MFTRNRFNLNPNVIEFPATKTAGALTITGDVVKAYEGGATGDMQVLVGAEDRSEITNGLVVRPYVSLDEGETWLAAPGYTELANGSGAVTALKTLAMVPRLRVDAVFDATGALAAGHGCKVHVEAREYKPWLVRKNLWQVDDNIPATKAAGSAATYTGTTVELPEYTSELVVYVTAEDLSTITDGAGTGITYQIQTSYEGVQWWDLLDSAGDIANGTGTLFAVNQVTTKVIGRYMRVVVSAAADAELAADHGIKVFGLALYQ